MVQLGTLPEPVEPKCSHKLARTIPSETAGDPVPNQPPGEHKDKHQGIQAYIPRVPGVGGRGGSLYIYIYSYSMYRIVWTYINIHMHLSLSLSLLVHVS